jgi:hypothetical protein
MTTAYVAVAVVVAAGAGAGVERSAAALARMAVLHPVVQQRLLEVRRVQVRAA